MLYSTTTVVGYGKQAQYTTPTRGHTACELVLQTGNAEWDGLDHGRGAAMCFRASEGAEPATCNPRKSTNPFRAARRAGLTRMYSTSICIQYEVTYLPKVDRSVGRSVGSSF